MGYGWQTRCCLINHQSNKKIILGGIRREKFNITVNGNAYEVEIEEVKAAAPVAAAPKAAPAAAPAPKLLQLPLLHLLLVTTLLLLQCLVKL